MTQASNRSAKGQCSVCKHREDAHWDQGGCRKKLSSGICGCAGRLALADGDKKKGGKARQRLKNTDRR